MEPQALSNLMPGITPPPAAGSGASPTPRPVAITPPSQSQALSLATRLAARLTLPEELPAGKLTSLDQVQLTSDEKKQLWGVVEEWAKDHKRAAINTAVYRRQISQKPAERPWPTAETIWNEVQRIGHRENPGFVVDDWLHEVLLALCLYFARDAQGFEDLDPSYSLEKGILLYGPVGCGKTKILELIGKVDPRLSFRVVPCPEVSMAYRKDGDAALVEFGKPITLGFDDLGFEDANARNYGNVANPLADILTKRYSLRPRPITHATTNDDAPAMLAKYGDRVYSRMAELFNIIQFSPAAPDRRLA